MYSVWERVPPPEEGPEALSPGLWSAGQEVDQRSPSQHENDVDNQRVMPKF